jgi:ubiquinone biosynthesis protein
VHKGERASALRVRFECYTLAMDEGRPDVTSSGAALTTERGAEESAPARKGELVRGLLRELGGVSLSTLQLTRGFVPLLKLLSSNADVTAVQLSAALDAAFAELYQHPLTRSTAKLTSFLRTRGLLPNEQSTENMLRYVVDQVLQRSPMPVPEALVKEFWAFFDELFAQPELKNLGEVSFEMSRLVLRTYEGTLVEVINLLKGSRRYNELQLREVMRRAGMVRGDITIVRRQLRALRHIRPFFLADPRDFARQAQIVAAMVREFGPFFVKLAQVAAANADFLPEEIGHELAVFHEDVPPMSADEVRAAFVEAYGRPPERMYADFDAEHPIKSGSIGSVYLARKPVVERGHDVLRTVIVKVGRQNIEREFIMGKLVIGLAIMSTHVWAPHSKLEPFLRSMQQQVDELVAGFVNELDLESEARNQLRFYERSRGSQVWKVPALYSATRRILEMEFVSDADSLTRAVRRLSARKRRRFQAQVSERLLYTLFNHVFVYNELHGDLHPGNIMVGQHGDLHLIDWGNVVQLEGLWAPVWRYLLGAVLADTDILTDALLAMSTETQADDPRRREIKALLDETLRKRGVSALSRDNALSELRHGGIEGLLQRGRTVLQLLANTQQSGVVISREYVHLSRSLLAAIGSFGTLYEDTSKRLLAFDVLRSLSRLPLVAVRDTVRRKLSRWRRRLLRWLPHREPGLKPMESRPAVVGLDAH